MTTTPKPGRLYRGRATCAHCGETLDMSAAPKGWEALNLEVAGWRRVKGLGWVCERCPEMPR